MKNAQKALIRRLKEQAAGRIRTNLPKGKSLVKMQRLTGTTASDLCRIRAGKLEMFSLDRLIQITHKMGHKVELVIDYGVVQ